MERHRHDDIGHEPVALARHDFRKLLGKPATERLDLLKL
jgi:hypothetical protein